MMSDLHPPALQYAAPRVFYCAEHRSRHWTTAFGVFLICAMGAACFFVVQFTPTVRAPIFLAWLFGMAGVGCAATAVYGLWLILTNEVKQIRLTEEGIEWGRSIYHWSDIRRIRGIRTAATGVYFSVERRRTLQISMSITPNAPMLKIDEYRALAIVIRPYLQAEFPHVEFADDVTVDNG